MAYTGLISSKDMEDEQTNRFGVGERTVKSLDRSHFISANTARFLSLLITLASRIIRRHLRKESTP